jgi:hypothetical protein
MFQTIYFYCEVTKIAVRVTKDVCSVQRFQAQGGAPTAVVVLLLITTATYIVYLVCDHKYDASTFPKKKLSPLTPKDLLRYIQQKLGTKVKKRKHICNCTSY